MNALIVTDWDDTEWEGIPDIIPFDELSNRPIGRDADETENDKLSPVTVGVMKNDSSIDRVYENWGYENEEIGVRTVNERENNWFSNSLDTLIVTDWDDTDWEGVPDIIPFEELSESPTGRDPNVVKNESSSPSTVGITENDSSIDRT